MQPVNDHIDIGSYGWLAAAVMGVWGFLLRLLVGRHIKQTDDMQTTLQQIDQRLSVIEGRLIERDHNGQRTWPGDSR